MDIRMLAAILAAFLAVSCGGGSSSSESQPVPAEDSGPPQDSAAEAPVQETGVDSGKDSSVDVEQEAASCQSGPESSPKACSDGCDNDGDKYVDCDDKDCCSIAQYCPPSTYCGKQALKEDSVQTCSDGVDNDKDNSFDCNDVSCCSVVQRPFGSGCNLESCTKGIAELVQHSPDHNAVPDYADTSPLSSAGQIDLRLSGAWASWTPGLSAPHTAKCEAADIPAGKEMLCTANVSKQQWAEKGKCGRIEGWLSLSYPNGVPVSGWLEVRFSANLQQSAP